MNYDQILARLDSLVRETFAIGDDPDYTAEVNLFDLGFCDSLGTIRILAFAEDAFGVAITQRDITLYPMSSVAEIARVVADKLG